MGVFLVYICLKKKEVQKLKVFRSPSNELHIVRH